LGIVVDQELVVHVAHRPKGTPMNSKIPYVLAMISGLIVPFIPESSHFLFTVGLIFFLGGSVFGYMWPKESWRWGLWMTGPMIALTGLSVLFAGQVDIFLEKDAPILLVALMSACAGSGLLAWFKCRELSRGENAS
jgi:hypothetical protein